MAITSTDSRIDSLSEEIRLLRRSNSNLRFLIFFAVLICLACSTLPLSSGQATSPDPQRKVVPEILETKELILRDEKGQVRARLGCDGPKSVSLRLFEGGVLRTDYRIWDNGVPSTNFYYANGVEAFSVGGGGAIEPGFDMFDRNGECRVQFGLGEGAPNMSFHHSKLNTRFQLGIRGFNGVPYMDFFDQKNAILPMLDKQGIPNSYFGKPK